MLILQPEIHETIWGSDMLSRIYDKSRRQIGHLYSCDPQPSGTIIRDGVYRGYSLYDYLHVSGYGADQLPFVIALVTPGQNLSIQVHPSDGIRRKNESWYFIKRPACGYIFNGCRIREKEKIRDAMTGPNPLAAVDRMSIEDEDYIYVRAGTMHAMTAGCFVYEIEEQNGDTYRFYDYDRVGANGRKRELQLSRGLETLKPEMKAEKQAHFRHAMEEKYSLDKIAGGVHRNRTGKLECLTLIGGKSKVEGVTLGMSLVLEPEEICDLGDGVYMAAY